MLDPRFRPDGEHVTATIAHPLLRANRASLTEYLDLSLEHRHDPYVLLELQKRLIRDVLTLQSKIREHRGAGNQREVALFKALRFFVKAIADGIAWRSLDYNRAVINELAFKGATGFIEEGSINEELQAAEGHVRDLNGTAFINDLTNCLLYGDVTVVTNEHVYIAEVKSGRGSRKSGKAKHQRRKTERLIEFINRKERLVDGKPERLARLSTQPRGYLHELSPLLTVREQSASLTRDCLMRLPLMCFIRSTWLMLLLTSTQS